MCRKAFLRESWSWSSAWSFPETNFQRTMTICAGRLSWGNLGHGHRPFLSQYRTILGEGEPPWSDGKVFIRSWCRDPHFRDRHVRRNFVTQAGKPWTFRFGPFFGLVCRGSVLFWLINHVYLNSVQQMVSGELAGKGLQTGFSRHGLPPQRAPLDTVYPLRKHWDNVQRMVSGGYCEDLFPDTVCWTRLRNTWIN